MQAITRLTIFTSFALLLTVAISSSATACDGYRRSFSYSNYTPVQTYSYGYGYGYGARNFAPSTFTPSTTPTTVNPSPAITPSIPAPSVSPIAPGPAVAPNPGPAQVDINPGPNPNQINPNQATLRDVAPPVHLHRQSATQHLPSEMLLRPLKAPLPLLPMRLLQIRIRSIRA
ncbi:MAG: hypothetical protein R3B91_10150 [Planctomycetaceae bacterium]